MPPSLFASETLVSVGLHVNFVVSVPENVRLPKLKEVFLTNIIMRDESDDEEVRRLFSSCPVLECLTVFSLKMYNHRVFDISVPSLKLLKASLYATGGELLINCPNLELLRCVSYPARGFFGDVLGFLKKCYIEMQLTEEQLKEGKVIELIEQVCKVQFLSLAGDSMQTLVSPPCTLPTFEILTHLELKPYHSKRWMLLSSMLESSPCL